MDSSFPSQSTVGKGVAFSNAAAGISETRTLRVASKVIYCFHQAQWYRWRQDPLDAARQGVDIFLRCVPPSRRLWRTSFPGGGISGVQGAESGGLLPGCERTRKAAAFQMERQKQKFCGEKFSKVGSTRYPARYIVVRWYEQGRG